MNQHHKKGTILGTSGEPLAKPSDAVEDLNLPPGVQALIEARVNTELDRLREQNRDELKDLANEHSKRWRTIAAITSLLSIAWGIFSGFVAPDWIRTLVADHVRKNVAEPAMKATMADAAQKAAVAYVGPLNRKVDEVRRQATTLQNEIAAKQDQLDKNQKTVRDEVGLFELSVSSKMGDGKALRRLSEIATADSLLRETAQIFQNEIQQYYDAERYNLVQRYVIEERTQNRINLSIEEAFEYLGSTNQGAREAAVNEIMACGRKSSVADLIGQLAKEEDLRVISRMTLAVQTVTKANFRPIDKSAVLEWWGRNKANHDFHFPNESYVAAMKKNYFLESKEGTLVVDTTVAREALPLFRDVLTHEPAASRTRSIVIMLELGLNLTADAEKDLAALEANQGNYWFTAVPRAAVLLSQKKTPEAIAALNGFFESFPTKANVVKAYAIFKPIVENKDLKWPTQPKD